MSSRGQRKAPEATARGEILQVELLQEKAANLGRLGRRLQRALAALRAWEQEAGAGGRDDRERRRGELLVDAAEALFLYVAQREVTGLRGTVAVLDELEVPGEVRLRMGPRSVQR